MKKKLLFGIVCVLLLPIVLYLTALFVSYDCDPDFLKIDSCLDAGGRWDYEERVCIVSQDPGLEREDPPSE